VGVPGSGTVTSVSVTTANGVSGSVATATTTPAITLTLGAITPSTVNGNTITTGSGTLTLGAGKTLTASNSLTFTGTDATSFAFPSTSDTVVTLAATQTLTNKTLTTAALGSSTATTQSAGDNSTKVATTAYVATQIAAGGALKTKIITVTRDRTVATGSQAYTGCGFAPTALIWLNNEADTNATILGVSDAALTSASLYDPSSVSNGFTIASSIGNGLGVNNVTFVLTSYDSDGFTGTWTRTGTPGGTASIKVMCMR
jgi:hypothetical protein